MPPGLVMAIMEIESNFNRYAVSYAGAVGLMQVMPFWPENLGMRRHQLIKVSENIRMGCAILRSYLKREKNNIARALARYNGSTGKRWYSDKVINQWTRWNGADDLGKASERHAEVKLTVALTVGRIGVFGGDVGDPRSRRTFPQPGDELVDRGILAAGQHLDAPVGEIARVAGEPERLGLAHAGGPIEHALHPARNKGTSADHAA